MKRARGALPGRIGWLFALALALALPGPGCGKQGDPLPPLKKTPRPVSAFSLGQRGDHLELSFVTPRETTDGLRLPVMQIELLRADRDGDFGKVARLETLRAAPGETLRHNEPLPPPGTTVRYAARVRVKGDTSSQSPVASLAVQAVVPAPDSLAARLEPGAVRLAWTIPPEAEARLAATPTPTPTPSPSPAASPHPSPPLPAAASSPAPAASPSPTAASTLPAAPPATPAGTAAAGPAPTPVPQAPPLTPQPPSPTVSPTPASTPPPVAAAASPAPATASPAPVGPTPAATATPAPTPTPTPPPPTKGVWLYRRTEISAYDRPLTPAPIPEAVSLEDPAVSVGTTYCYVARVVLATQPVVESAASPEACVAVRDIVAPAPPQGVTALPLQRAVEVAWSPATEADVVFHRVYRKVRGKPRERLAEVKLPETSYRDESPPSGAPVVYSVTAVDKAGNESPPSQAAPVRLP